MSKIYDLLLDLSHLTFRSQLSLLVAAGFPHLFWYLLKHLLIPPQVKTCKCKIIRGWQLAFQVFSDTYLAKHLLILPESQICGWTYHSFHSQKKKSKCMFVFHREWVSEWLLFNTNSAIFQLYHGENKLIFNEMVMRSVFF